MFHLHCALRLEEENNLWDSREAEFWQPSRPGGNAARVQQFTVDYPLLKVTVKRRVGPFPLKVKLEVCARGTITLYSFG